MESATDVEVREDIRQSEEYGRYMERIGWKTIQFNKSQIFIRRLGPVSVAKMQRGNLSLPWSGIDKVLRENRVMMCKIEPNAGAQTLVLSAHGYQQDNWPLLGTKTLRVDLSRPLGLIRQSFKKDARYCLRRVHGSPSKVSKNHFEDFYQIWKKSGKIKRLWIPSERSYQALVEVFGEKAFCVTVNNLAGCLVLTHERTAYYYYSGALPEGKRFNLPYLVVWEAMKEAKKRGCKQWDFEGIYDSRWPNQGWRGFSHFKKSFDGIEVEFPGCFTKWMWPFPLGRRVF